MAARTGKRSILTILRNKRGMWTVYQTKVICVWIIMEEYDLWNKFADNKMLLLLFKKCWTMLHALKLPCWKVKWWAIQLTFPQCEESQERRVLFRLTNSKKLAVCWAIKKVAEKAGKRKGCKRRENTKPVYCKARETCNRVSAGKFLKWQISQQSEKQTNNLYLPLDNNQGYPKTFVK